MSGVVSRGEGQVRGAELAVDEEVRGAEVLVWISCSGTASEKNGAILREDHGECYALASAGG